jgi:hypothetical protein
VNQVEVTLSLQIQHLGVNLGLDVECDQISGQEIGRVLCQFLKSSGAQASVLSLGNIRCIGAR